MSLALQGPRDSGRASFNRSQKERLRLHETDQFDLRDRSPCYPTGRIFLRPRLSENLTARGRKNFPGCLYENVTSCGRDVASNRAVLSCNRNSPLHISRAHGRVSRPLHSRRAGQGHRTG